MWIHFIRLFISIHVEITVPGLRPRGTAIATAAGEPDL
jgi:hypothetical protein